MDLAIWEVGCTACDVVEVQSVEVPREDCDREGEDRRVAIAFWEEVPVDGHWVPKMVLQAHRC